MSGRSQSFADARPDLAHLWDDNADVNTVSSNSKIPRSWKCEMGHTWTAPPLRMVKSRGCPHCGGRRLLAGFNDLATTHPEIAAEWCGDEREPAPTEVSAGSNKKMTWSCERGHVWSASPKSRTRGHGCPVCSHNAVATGEGDLASVRPDVAALWRHPVDAALGDVNAHAVSPSSNIDVEWESRRASWDYALRHDPLGTISRNMFMREFDDGDFTLCALGDNSDLWDHLPDFVRSRTSRARSLLSSALLCARASDIDSSNFFSAFRSAERCVHNNEDALNELARILPTPSHEYVLNRHDVDADVVAIVDAVVANADGVN